MRDLVFLSVTSIIHDKCTLCLLLLDNSTYLRVGVTSCRRYTGVSIPHHLLYLIVRIGRHNGFCGLIDIVHVEIIISIITHEHDNILPTAAILILCIADCLID